VGAVPIVGREIGLRARRRRPEPNTANADRLCYIQEIDTNAWKLWRAFTIRGGSPGARGPDGNLYLCGSGCLIRFTPPGPAAEAKPVIRLIDREDNDGSLIISPNGKRLYITPEDGPVYSTDLKELTDFNRWVIAPESANTLWKRMQANSPARLRPPGFGPSIGQALVERGDFPGREVSAADVGPRVLADRCRPAAGSRSRRDVETVALRTSECRGDFGREAGVRHDQHAVGRERCARRSTRRGGTAGTVSALRRSRSRCGLRAQRPRATGRTPPTAPRPLPGTLRQHRARTAMRTCAANSAAASRAESTRADTGSGGVWSRT